MGLLLKMAIGALVAFVLICGLALAFSARPTPLIGLDGTSLAHSVDPDMTSSKCVMRSDGDWRCKVADGPEVVAYRVDVRWDGCWEATRGASEKSGCVDIWDHLRLEDALSDATGD